jgi:hypothetical protein
MRYTVVWQTRADAQLINLWLSAADRQAVTDAANRIDRALRDDAEKKGKPIGRFFTYVDDPLKVMYHVEPRDRMVWVMQVRYTT